MLLEAVATGERPGREEAPAAGTDRLDLEAAEQLVQLSGGDGGESETKSADSVCREKDKEQAAVESRRRSAAAAERFPAREDDDGEALKRPRFRSLADIYRATGKKRAAGEEGVGGPRKMVGAGGEEGEGPRKMKRAGGEEGERPRKMTRAADEEREKTMKKRRAAGGAIPVKVSKGDEKRSGRSSSYACMMQAASPF